MQSIRIAVSLEPFGERAALVPTHDVVPDFVDGWALGTALGVGVKSVAGWWTVIRAILPEIEVCLCLLHAR